MNEVQWINALNAEEVQEQLQARLAEIELRFKAAADRRQERLENISGKQKRYHSHKSQQMSSMRLRIEMERMERWQRLQEKIEAVQRRREKRLLEIQRRITVVDSGAEAEGEPSPEVCEGSSPQGYFEQDGKTDTKLGHHQASLPKKRRSKKRCGGFILQLRFAMDRVSEGKMSSFAAAAGVVRAILHKKVRETLLFYFPTDKILLLQTIKSILLDGGYSIDDVSRTGAAWIFRADSSLSNVNRTDEIEILRRDIANMKMIQPKEMKLNADANNASFLLHMVITDSETTFVEEELINSGVYYSMLETLESIAKDDGSLRLHYTTSVSTLLMQLTLLSLDASVDNLRHSTSILSYTTWLLGTSSSCGIEGQIAIAFVFAAGLIFAIVGNLSGIAIATHNQPYLNFIEAIAVFLSLILNKLRS